MNINPSLIIFANFRIDNEERYLRMKDSLLSFKKIAAKKWVINVRGNYKEKTLLFLKNNLGNKLVYSQLESKYGWFHDTRKLLKEIDSDFVLFWLEDHINLSKIEEYEDIIVEMQQNKCDQLTYTWWYPEFKDVFSPIKSSESKRLDYFEINPMNIKKLEQLQGRYLIPLSIPGIFSVSFFKKIIQSNHPKLKRWPKATPFDFEKRSTDIEFMNFKHALPKFELFASIDDNNRSKGAYCLIDRGMYENRISREEMLIDEKREKKTNPLPEWLKRPLRLVLTFIKRIRYTYE